MPPDVFTIGQFVPRTCVAVFDYDWTLVKPKSGFIHPKSKDDVEWLNDRVVPTLTELQREDPVPPVVYNMYDQKLRQTLDFQDC